MLHLLFFWRKNNLWSTYCVVRLVRGLRSIICLTLFSVVFWFSQLPHWPICSSRVLLSGSGACGAGAEREGASEDRVRHAVAALRANTDGDAQNPARGGGAARQRAVQQRVDSAIPETKRGLCKSALCYIRLCVRKWRRYFPVAFRSSYVSAIDRSCNRLINCYSWRMENMTEWYWCPKQL